jgi:20S proteasome subunit alpha 5
VEYAIEAIKLGSTAIGVTCSEGVVLGVERRLNSPLIVPSSIEKIFELDKHVGCATSGIVSDARTLVDYAIAEAQGHVFTFNEPMRVESLT